MAENPRKQDNQAEEEQNDQTMFTRSAAKQLMEQTRRMSGASGPQMLSMPSWAVVGDALNPNVCL
jgi:hypothetical protein